MGDWSASGGVTVGFGTTEFTTRWLEPGETLKCSITLTGGDIVRVVATWVPEDAASEAPRCEIVHDAMITTAQTAQCSYTARGGAGVLWICADNVASWMRTKTITATIVSEALPPTASDVAPLEVQ